MIKQKYMFSKTNGHMKCVNVLKPVVSLLYQYALSGIHFHFRIYMRYPRNWNFNVDPYFRKAVYRLPGKTIFFEQLQFLPVNFTSGDCMYLSIVTTQNMFCCIQHRFNLQCHLVSHINPHVTTINAIWWLHLKLQKFEGSELLFMLYYHILLLFITFDFVY